MADDKTLREKILSSEDYSIFFRLDFPEYHTESVGRVLSELTGEGQLLRIASGIYVKPRMSRFGPVRPSVDKIVSAIAERDKVQVLPAGVVALNMLGLSTQVPMVYFYLTMGSARTIKFDGFIYHLFFDKLHCISANEQVLCFRFAVILHLAAFAKATSFAPQQYKQSLIAFGLSSVQSVT